MKLTDRSCSESYTALDANDLLIHLQDLPGWQLLDGALVHSWHFADYYRTMAFVNALAFIAHQENHHPDLSVHFNRVVVRFSTHDADGITLNDVICAAKCSALAGAHA
ncbi:4a-hydroxytetrahydrobiopterin dehydratase [Craterilacuibacter sp. RT1T]|uniref:4a-hydroxytetrahydrobiopterin dehydratase n=1 Tax=Craterilacuibacter sp. RT1T TaxID=2942211 RepID=UPI0020BFC7EA|nr:4a-hydroxytetrahydrobiopterin dehydratase [Craterilacuibacter sp. RT1T]MCL6263307.1 4a-hydroxytetrahydrobiopterin dehydratase [Craterilacuibacter sp. RT1T]